MKSTSLYFIHLLLLICLSLKSWMYYCYLGISIKNFVYMWFAHHKLIFLLCNYYALNIYMSFKSNYVTRNMYNCRYPLLENFMNSNIYIPSLWYLKLDLYIRSYQQRINIILVMRIKHLLLQLIRKLRVKKILQLIGFFNS